MDFKVGIHAGIPFEEYHAIKAVGSSMLRDVDSECAAYALWARDQPEVQARYLTVQKKGTALHAMLLEPEKFESDFVQTLGCEHLLKTGPRKGQPCGSGTGSLFGDGRFLCGIHDGDAGTPDPRICIDTDGMSELQKMAAAVRGVAGPALDTATHREVTLLWIDEETGLPCKARPDFISGRTIFDLKALADVAPARWGQILVNSGMFFQPVHYLAGAAALGLEVDKFAWIAVRNAEPYLAIVHPPLDDASMEAAEALWRDRLNSLAECEAAKVWPGYTVPEFSSLPTYFVNTFGEGV